MAQALELAEEDGDGTSIEWLCRHRPDLQPRVEAAIRMSERFPTLQLRSVDSDGAPMIGERYEIEERLGSGAMGAVWSAYDIRLGRRVAVKVMEDSLDLGVTSAERFDREAKALAAIRHPAVVAVYDSGLTETGDPFLVMENVEGVSLADLFDRSEGESGDWAERLRDALDAPSLASLEPLYERQLARWIAELASGLQDVHQAGVVHRDVKPSNIMIRENGEAVLVDFGIAFVEGQSDLTATNASIGTPAYMAPEAADGRTGKRETRLVQSLDVWSLGATLYRGLTGQAPYVGTPSEVMRALATRDPKSIEQLAPGVPKDLRAIVEHAMERRPSSRYSTTGALAADLSAFLEHRQVSVRPIGRVGRLLRVARRSRVLNGAALALAAVALVMGMSALRTVRQRNWDKESIAAMVAVPANITVTSPFLRWIDREDDRKAMLGSLDRLVNSEAHPIASRALRASLRLDFHDLEGASQDMAAIAAELGTPYSHALAALYAALEGPEANVAQLPLGDLPAPTIALDHYLFGYHELRQLRRESARKHLLIPDLVEHRHARELAVLCASLEIDKFGKKSQKEQRDAAVAEMLRQARQVESDFGYRSAMSAYLIATPLCILRRWNLALETASESFALSPWSVPAIENAALAALRLRRHEEVERFAEVGLRLVPKNSKLQEHWIRSASSFGLAEEALARVEAVTFRSESTKRYLRALVLANAALSDWDAGDMEGMNRWAQKVTAACHAGDPERKSTRFEGLRLLAEGLRTDDEQTLFLAGLKMHSTNQLSLSLLDFLCRTFPDKLPPEAAPYLRSVLETVHNTVRSRDLVDRTDLTPDSRGTGRNR